MEPDFTKVRSDILKDLYNAIDEFSNQIFEGKDLRFGNVMQLRDELESGKRYSELNVTAKPVVEKKKVENSNCKYANCLCNPNPSKYYTIDEAIERMKANPGLKMRYVNYRSFQYQYYDEKLDKFICDDGSEWNIRLSRNVGELTHFHDFH